MKNEKDKLNKNGAEAETPLTEEKPVKKAKNPKRWTVVDTVLVLMLLLAIGGILMRGFLPEVSLADTDKDVTAGPYYVEFAVAEIHPMVLSEINAFDPLYLYDTGELVGYVGVYDDGSIALHTVALQPTNPSGNVAVEGCMVCLEGVYREGSLLVKGMDTYLSLGSTLVLRTDRAVFTVEITDIRISE